jgi:hypothetical protein
MEKRKATADPYGMKEKTDNDKKNGRPQMLEKPATCKKARGRVF